MYVSISFTVYLYFYTIDIVFNITVYFKIDYCEIANFNFIPQNVFAAEFLYIEFCELFSSEHASSNVKEWTSFGNIDRQKFAAYSVFLDSFLLIHFCMIKKSYGWVITPSIQPGLV